MMQPAVRFSPDVETLAPDEAQVIRDLSDTLHDIMETTSRDYGHAVRGADFNGCPIHEPASHEAMT